MTAIDTIDLVDPELLPLLEIFPTIRLTPEALLVFRADASRMPIPPVGPEAATVEMTRRKIPGPEGSPDVEVLIYRPPNNTGVLPCILHIHGGGYVLGSASAKEAAHRTQALTLNCIIVTVDYRLAPETVFPGAVEDCYAALRWVFTEGAGIGIDLARTGVSGESAGGGLAASLALLARDREEFALAFQHLICPMIDDRTCISADPHPYTGQFIWTLASNHFGWAAILDCEPGSERVSPYAAAARAEDLSGLPPTFISTGALDLFLEENLEYARRLLRAGVPTELHVYPGAYHGFELSPDADVAKQSRRDSFAALAKKFKV